MTCSFEEDSIYKKHLSGKINVEKQASKCVIAQAQPDSMCLAFLQAIGQLFSYSSMRFAYLTSRVADHICICK